MTVIDWDESVQQDVVVDGKGWRQVTPANGGRYYEDTAPTCPIAEATTERFASLTHTLRTCFPTDFTGPTKWNVARAAVGERHVWNVMPDDDAVRWLVDQADVTLNAAADRGSAIHRAIEARILGHGVDHHDLEVNGASDYLAAVEAFLRACDPQPSLVETVAIGRDSGTACTLDYAGTLKSVDGVVVVDWKTRTKNHDRRPKEAAQLGGIIDMACGGYYFDDRGCRRRLEVDGCGIVTFAPDGTWKYHPVEPSVAVESWRTALTMRRFTLVSEVYGKATGGPTLDVAAICAERLAAIPVDSRERNDLAMAWRQHGLPAIADLTVSDWALADHLLTMAEPFAGPNPKPTTFATNDECRQIADRIRALPPDLREQVTRSGGGLPPLTSPTLSAEDLEDWERLVTPAESTAAGRLVEINIILRQIEEGVDA